MLVYLITENHKIPAQKSLCFMMKFLTKSKHNSCYNILKTAS